VYALALHCVAGQRKANQRKAAKAQATTNNEQIRALILN
jgi:hypothetical protein